jgi:hypothetical protein
MDFDELSQVEVSPSGRIHLAWATLDAEYLQMMTDVTPLRDEEVYEEIVACYTDYKRKWRHAIRAFIEYLLSEDATWCRVPDHPAFSGQLSVTKRLGRLASRL